MLLSQESLLLRRHAKGDRRQILSWPRWARELAPGRNFGCVSAFVREGRGSTLFLTSSFDLGEPFSVELELGPGRWLFTKPARLGAARREQTPAPR